MPMDQSDPTNSLIVLSFLRWHWTVLSWQSKLTRTLCMLPFLNLIGSDFFKAHHSTILNRICALGKNMSEKSLKMNLICHSTFFVWMSQSSGFLSKKKRNIRSILHYYIKLLPCKWPEIETSVLQGETPHQFCIISPWLM